MMWETSSDCVECTGCSRRSHLLLTFSIRLNWFWWFLAHFNAILFWTYLLIPVSSNISYKVLPSVLWRCWSTYWPSTFHFILHTFLHPVIVFFLQHMPMMCVLAADGDGANRPADGWFTVPGLFDRQPSSSRPWRWVPTCDVSNGT